MKKRLLALAAAGFLVFAFTGACLAEPELSVTGWFRVRSYWIPNIALDKTSTRERAYSDQRLILDPVLKITDAVQIKMRIRALDYIWGYNTMPGWNFDRQIDENSQRTRWDPSNITWDRAWAVISLGKYGLFQIGRMDGSTPTELTVAYDDTWPRYNYIIPAITMPESIGGVLIGGIFYDKRTEGDIDKTFGVGSLRDPSGETTAFAPWFYLLARDFRVFYFWFPFIFHYPEGEGGNALIHFHSTAIHANLGPVDFEGEFTYMPGELIPGFETVNNTAFYVDLSVPVENEELPVTKVAVQVGFAGGCVDPAEHPESAFAPGALGPGVGSYTLSKFGLDGCNPEFDVDLILWDQIYASLRNAMYIRGRVDFKIPETKVGGYLAGIYSIANQYARFQPPWSTSVATTMDDEKGMGFEIDLGISYELAEKSSIVLGLGYFMPGKYFAEPRDGTLGATVKTNIWF